MIRRPTPKADQYDFWSRSVAGERVPRVEDEPKPGFYKRRMIRNGPFVPVEIWLEQEVDPDTGELTADETLMATSDGKPCDPLAVWLSARAISAEEFDGLNGIRSSVPDMSDTQSVIDLGRIAAIRP